MLEFRGVKQGKQVAAKRRLTVAAPFAQGAFEELKSLPVSCAVLDTSGTIVAVNEAWRTFGRANGLRMSNDGIGANYIDFCDSQGGAPAQLAADLRNLLAGARDVVTLVYPCHSPRKERWFSLVALPLSLHAPAGVAVLHIDLTTLIRDPSAACTGLTTNSGEEDWQASYSRMVSSAVEASAAQSLSSQLNEMLSVQPRRSSPDARSRKKNEAELMRVQKQLSKRQREVFRLLGEGKTNGEIARALFRSPNTIKLHVSAILKQFDMRNRTQAALLASRLLQG